MQKDLPPVRVADVMTSHVRTAGPRDLLEDIWNVLAEQRCHHIPIVEGDKPVGMISMSDLVRIARKHGAKKLSEANYGSATAGEVMTRELEKIHLDEPVDVAIDRIGEGDIHALVVVDDGDALVGIVTHRDLLHYLMID